MNVPISSELCAKLDLPIERWGTIRSAVVHYCNGGDDLLRKKAVEFAQDDELFPLYLVPRLKFTQVCETDLPPEVMSIAKDKMGKMTEEGDWSLESYSFDDVEVSTPAPDVAIIAYTVRQKVRMNGKSQEMRAADSSTWIRGADGWACHAHSETFLQEGAA